MVDHLDLVRDLGATEDGRERALGRLEQLGQHLDLAFHEQARVGRQELGDPDRRGMRPMGRAECVVDVDIGVGSQRGGEPRIVLLFLRVEAQVLQEEHLAGTQPLDRVLCPDAQGIARHRDVSAKQLRQTLTDRPKAEAVLHLSVRTAQVAGEDDPSATLEQQVDGRERGPDPRVVGDLAVRKRDVEIDAHEDPLVRDLRVADGHLVHGRSDRDGQARRHVGDQIGDPAAVAPLVVVPGDDLDHRVPEDHRRLGVDEIELRLSPLKSIDTRCSSDTPRIPLSGPAAATRKASLRASFDVGRLTIAVKSTTLTVGVGTRRLNPSNLPLSSGMTRARALAAPVVVGMMFCPAERARRGSLWATSRIRWSLV